MECSRAYGWQTVKIQNKFTICLQYKQIGNLQYSIIVKKKIPYYIGKITLTHCKNTKINLYLANFCGQASS